MKLICPKCSREVGEVEAFERLILTVHCPFDGHDFGVAVDPTREPVAQVVTDGPAALGADASAPVPVKPGAPSAADLDAVAEEQKAEADTAAPAGS